jgi:hypothetical protein
MLLPLREFERAPEPRASKRDQVPRLTGSAVRFGQEAIAQLGCATLASPCELNNANGDDFSRRLVPDGGVAGKIDGRFSAIVSFLKGAAFEPQDVQAMSMALDDVCKALKIDGDVG